MSNNPHNFIVKDLVFVKKSHSNGQLVVSPIDGHEINGMPLENLHGLKSLNLIVGANNSGKSRFVRSLLRLEFRLVANETWHDLKKIYGTFEDVFHGKISNIQQYINIINLDGSLLMEDIEPYINHHNIFNPTQLQDIKKLHKQLIEASVEYFRLRSSIYIPALRTAHTLYDKGGNPLAHDFFMDTLNKNYPEIKSVENNYNNKKPQIDVFTGGNLYEEIRKARNSIRETRERFEEFELFLSEIFFDGKEVDVVAIDEEGSRRINIHIEGSESNKDIHELGDGIQAIIILMYKVFMADENTLIVIDEPEQHLHPGLQRIFMQATQKLLKERNNNNLVFIVTHSNHLMDLTLTQEDVSIYSFSKNKDKENSPVKVRACKASDYSLLSELGVTSSSAFIANTSIWVEGPTDRKYLRFFLNKYLEKKHLDSDYKRLKEDIDYAFYEYGGSLLSHYDFSTDEDGNFNFIDKIRAFSLANRIFLLSDRDATTSTGKDEKSVRLRILQEISDQVKNFSFNKTSGIEIENMLPEYIYKDYVHTLYQGTPTLIVKKNIEDSIKDSENEKIGNVLLNAIKPNSLRAGIEKHKEFKSKNGALTTSYKNSLCDYVCEIYKEKSYDELVIPKSGLDKLILNLYEFILNKEHELEE